MQCGALCLSSLLAATILNSIVIGYKMQLTGYHNSNEMRNATCVETNFEGSDSSEPTVIPYTVVKDSK